MRFNNALNPYLGTSGEGTASGGATVLVTLEEGGGGTGGGAVATLETGALARDGGGGFAIGEVGIISTYIMCISLPYENANSISTLPPYPLSSDLLLLHCTHLWCSSRHCVHGSKCSGHWGAVHHTGSHCSDGLHGRGIGACHCLRLA